MAGFTARVAEGRCRLHHLARAGLDVAPEVQIGWQPPGAARFLGFAHHQGFQQAEHVAAAPEADRGEIDEILKGPQLLDVVSASMLSFMAAERGPANAPIEPCDLAAPRACGTDGPESEPWLWHRRP